MGALLPLLAQAAQHLRVIMAKAMKAKSVKVLTKGGVAESLASATNLKKAECSKVLNHLAEIGTKELKKNGKFTLHGLVTIKTRIKPATQAGKREMFGKVVTVKAMKARTVV